MEIREPGAAPSMECRKGKGGKGKKKKKKKCCKGGATYKQCKVTVGGCADKKHKKHKKKKKKCTGTIKRPLPECPKEDFSNVGEEFNLNFPLFQKLKETSAKKMEDEIVIFNKLRIDNTAEIINVSVKDIPQPKCPEVEKPMKLKARFWSNVARTIRLQPEPEPAQS